MAEREIIPVRDPATFVAWAIRACKRVRMVRTASATLELKDGMYVHEPAIRIDYGFDIVSADNTSMRTWTYSEVCRVRLDGEIVFPDGSPYPALRDAGHEVTVTHPRSGAL